MQNYILLDKEASSIQVTIYTPMLQHLYQIWYLKKRYTCNRFIYLSYVFYRKIKNSSHTKLKNCIKSLNIKLRDPPGMTKRMEVPYPPVLKLVNVMKFVTNKTHSFIQCKLSNFNNMAP